MFQPSYPFWSASNPPTLLASRHRLTSEILFPALSGESPLSPMFETVPVARVGKLYSFTVIHPNPKSGQQPYALGYVDFPGPLRIFGRLGVSVRPVIGQGFSTRQDDELGYVFEPTANETARSAT